MTQFTMLLCLSMMVICYLLLNRSFKPVYKKIIKTYFFIFATFALTVSGLSLYQSKDQWFSPAYTWMETQVNGIHLLAVEQTESDSDEDFTVQEKTPLKEQVHLDVEIIGQYPELPRGCEVTSLAMLLNYNSIQVDKMELAEKVAKDPTPFKQTGNKIFFGNPNTGFVGDMYSLKNPGYGVYHGPVAELARKYAGERVKDFSGGNFYEVLNQLNEGRPVWVIINTTYDELPAKQFTTWNTPDGEISITKKEHSVVVTGYDAEYIYFNDPLEVKKRKAPIERFKKAWVQMGKQAVTVVQP